MLETVGSVHHYISGHLRCSTHRLVMMLLLLLLNEQGVLLHERLQLSWTKNLLLQKLLHLVKS
jgi:hypothetical protein